MALRPVSRTRRLVGVRLNLLKVIRVLWYIVFIAVGNLCLGFAWAVQSRRWTLYAGVGYPAAPDSDTAATSPASVGSETASGQPSAAAVAGPMESPIAQPKADSPAVTAPVDEHDPGETPGLDFDAPDSPEPQRELPPPRDKSPTEMISGAVMVGLQKFRTQIGELDARIRKCAKTRNSR